MSEAARTRSSNQCASAQDSAVETSHRTLLAQLTRDAPTLAAGTVEQIPRLAARDPVLQRVLEVIIAGAMLVFAVPVMLVLAAIIKLDTPGPALFRQQRLGRDGKLFTFIKFRTLYVDAKQRFPELYAYKYADDEIQSMQFKTADDPRITPKGKWIRSSSLDELPNLFLVLTGKMALVGPRPQIPEMLPYYKGIMLERFSVRPGLTDTAHVSGRSNLSFYETTAMDVAYVRERSWRLDIATLIKTARVVIQGDGAF